MKKKTKKQKFAIILALLLLVSSLGGNVTVSAQEDEVQSAEAATVQLPDTEEQTIAEASSGGTLTGSTDGSDFYYFSFTTEEAGVCQITVKADYDQEVDYGIYDEEEDDYPYWINNGLSLYDGCMLFNDALSADTTYIYYFKLPDLTETIDFSITIDFYPEGDGLSGTWDENMTWSLYGGILTISGEGEMSDSDDRYVYDDTPNDLGDLVTGVVIDSGITSIGEGAFGSAYQNIENISISETVTSIGSEAFYWTDALEEVVIPGNVETIGSGAFSACENLSEITLEYGVKEILYCAFEDAAVTEITIPASVTYLGGNIFRCCNKLTSVTFEGDAPELETTSDSNGFEYSIFGSFDEDGYDFPAEQSITVYYSSKNDGWTSSYKTLLAGGSDVTFVDLSADEAISLSEAEVILSASSYTYTGSEKKPTPTVKLTLDGETITLTKNTDYTVSYSDNVNAGKATVTITGTGNYTGTAKAVFTIKPVSIAVKSSAYVSCTLSTTSYTYSGSAKKPSVTLKVKVNGKTKTLSKSSSSGYTVSYKNNTKIGKATVTITGTGNYTGTITKTFKIYPKKGTISSLKSSAKKKMTVKWKTISGSVTKYQVRYRVKGTSKWTTKTYSSSTKSKTITGLKSGKTYQVQVRAYKTVDGTKYYGSWSSTKTVKVK